MAPAAVQPDISYEPDFGKYEARTRRRLDQSLDSTLPVGFPKHLDSELAWKGNELNGPTNDTESWVYSFDEQQLKEIDEALVHFKALNKSLGYLNSQTFPLPTLHSILRSLSRDLHFGRGFFVLRRLPVEKYSREENVIIYAGISSHIGSIRGRQDNKYNGKPADVVLSHIINLSHTADNSIIGAPAYTTDKQVFHTDTGDIVSLLALSEAAEGGESQIASSWNVYNELASSRPDLIRTLADDWIIDGFNHAEKPCFKRPLLYHQPQSDNTPERVVIQYSRRTFTGFGALPRSADIPPITEAQAEALDALHFLAEKNQLVLDIKKGDVQYINNLSLFHARKAFVDDAQNSRHLLRLWLRDPEYAWQTPEALVERWAGLYDEITQDSEVFPLEPIVRSASHGGKKV